MFTRYMSTIYIYIYIYVYYARYTSHIVNNVYTGMIGILRYTMKIINIYENIHLLNIILKTYIIIFTYVYKRKSK